MGGFAAHPHVGDISMKIRMLVGMMGPATERVRGDEIDLPANEAGRLIDAGFAEVVRSSGKETAIQAQRIEKASKV